MKQVFLSMPDQTLDQLIMRSCSNYGNKILFSTSSKNYSFSELHILGKKFSVFLKNQGIQRGDRVVVYNGNVIETIIALLGIIYNGSVFVLVNPKTKFQNLRFILEDSEAKVLVCNFDKIKNNFKKLNEVSSLISIINTKQNYENKESSCLNFSDIYSVNVEEFKQSHNISTNLAGLIYTSGSTGFPKGVMVSHHNIIFTIKSLNSYLRINFKDHIFSTIPLSFDYGLYQLFLAISTGAKLSLHDNFVFTSDIVKTINKIKPTVFPGVPSIFKLLLKNNQNIKNIFPSLRILTNTAAALSENDIPKLSEIFPNAYLFKMYGVTECKRVSFLNPINIDNKMKSVGKAIPGTEVFLKNSHGRVCNANEVGELCVKGDHVMMGYWKRPIETNYVIKYDSYTGEKYLNTHDLFYFDEDGYLYFLGRSDDIIKVKGEKVAPLEVEKCLQSIDCVENAAVIGEPDPLWGERVVAYIVKSKLGKFSLKAIKKHCVKNLETFKIPQDFRIVNELPLSLNGKIQKQKLIS